MPIRSAFAAMVAMFPMVSASGLVAMLAALVALAVPISAAAQAAFPARPIRLLIPYAAGSGADTSSRLVAEQMARELGQPVVVENRPGGSGTIAAVALKAAPADGYTILAATTSPISVNPLTVKNLPYDPAKDFRPLHGIARSLNAWYVAPDSPIRTVGDLVAEGRKRRLNVGSYSVGYQLVAEWFAEVAGIQIAFIGYKGQAQVINDVRSGALDIGMGDAGGVHALANSDKLRVLAVSGADRLPQLPGVPTFRESGFPGYETYAWTSLYVHAETPDPIHAKLVKAVASAVRSPEATAYFKSNGSFPMTDFGPEKMGRYQADEIERYRSIAARIGLKPE